jgi:tetratricopeptide (TPR) repeat protein
VAPPRPAAAPKAAKAAPGVPAELTRILDEIDSYVSLGFVDDAKEALQEASGRFPGHPALMAKIAELGFEEAAEAPEEPAAVPRGQEFDLGSPGEAPAADDMFGELGMEEPPPPAEEVSVTDDLVDEPAPESPAFGEPEPSAFDATSPEDLLGMTEAVPPPAEPSEGLDLGAELGELFGAQSAVEEAAPSAASTELGDAGLADIFKEFKKGVDKQLGKEDYDTRYNLGIAYKEMGLIDEAIAEFQLAAKDENRLLECSSMLGICFMEKGMPKLAIKWFDKGLKVGGRSEEEYAGLRYDLATAFEASGETDKALSLFTDLYGQDANFRDVATKVRELRAARS